MSVGFHWVPLASTEQLSRKSKRSIYVYDTRKLTMLYTYIAKELRMTDADQNECILLLYGPTLTILVS